MAFGPSFKLGHTPEARLFIHFWRLEVIARYPNPTNASTAGLRDEGIQQCARVTASSICLIDPHLFKFGSACPGISCGNANRASRLVVDHEAESSTVITIYCISIVLIEKFFDSIDFIRRKIVPGLNVGGHTKRSIR